jgi:hypothetical protein
VNRPAVPDVVAGGPAPSGPEADALAERVAAAVLAHPSVARLHGGRYNDVATHLAAGRLVGVRIGGGPGEPVEVAVVLWLDRPIPDVVAGLRATVSALCGGRRVDITVADVATDDDAPEPEPAHPSGAGVAPSPDGPDAGRMGR